VKHHDLQRSDGAVLVSVPHAGTWLPPAVTERMTPIARGLPDTDWWVDQLWQDAPAIGASLLVARASRFFIDINRPPGDEPLYDRVGTGLVPLETFAGEAIYLPGREPDAAEARQRLESCWRPYHAELQAELDRIRSLHGYAILLDGHSIRSRVPRLFDGRLHDLNLGSDAGRSAAPGLVDLAWAALGDWEGRTRVRDGRFRGGYITRHYGRPEQGVHALQLEMAQSVYMQEQPPQPEAGLLANVRRQCAALLNALMSWTPDGA